MHGGKGVPSFLHHASDQSSEKIATRLPLLSGASFELSVDPCVVCLVFVWSGTGSHCNAAMIKHGSGTTDLLPQGSQKWFA